MSYIPIYEEAVHDYLALVNGPHRIIGGRRISPPLEQGEYLLIQRPPASENKRWPEWVASACREWARSDSVDLLDLLDQLADASVQEDE